MRKNGIAVAGSILVDEINTVSAYPKAGELTKILSTSKSVGGLVPNVGIDLKKILPELTVSAIGKIGKDENGSFVKDVLAGNGVEIDGIVETDEKTSFTQVISVSGGQRTFFTYPGASADFGDADIDFSKLDVDLFHLGYFLLLDKIDGGDGIKILKAAKENGIDTSIDLVSENSDRYRTVLPCLPFTDYLIINELEAGRLTGIDPEIKKIPEMAKKLLMLGVNKKVIVHFPDGAVCADKGGNMTALGSYRLPDGYIKGTTGAGDAFCAGALVGIEKGLPDEEILILATDCATMALGTADATSGLTDQRTAHNICKGFERKSLCL